jgi:hypothetical protein
MIGGEGSVVVVVVVTGGDVVGEAAGGVDVGGRVDVGADGSRVVEVTGAGAGLVLSSVAPLRPESAHAATKTRTAQRA